MKMPKSCKKKLSALPLLGTHHEVDRVSAFACMRINILSSTTVQKNPELICGHHWEFSIAIRHRFITCFSALLQRKNMFNQA